MTLDRSKVPVTAAFPSLELPQPRREQINENLDFFIYQTDSQPIVSIDVIWQAGGW